LAQGVQLAKNLIVPLVEVVEQVAEINFRHVGQRAGSLAADSPKALSASTKNRRCGRAFRTPEPAFELWFSTKRAGYADYRISMLALCGAAMPHWTPRGADDILVGSRWLLAGGWAYTCSHGTGLC
jgi:hypothetical protein